MPLSLYLRGDIWHLRGSVAGQRIRKSTGLGVKAKREAELYRARLEGQLLERHTLGRRATLTFAEAALAYMEAGGETRFLGRILEYFGPMTKLAEIDTAAINAAAAALYPEASPATLNRQLIGPISAVFNLAARDGLCERRIFRRYPERNTRLRWLTPAEADRLIAAAAPHLVPALGFLLGGGCRTGEALRIERADFRPETGEAQIHETKNDHARVIRLPARAIDLVLSRPLPEIGAVLRTPKGAPYVQRQAGGGQLAGAFTAARSAAGLGAEVTPHTLRHTWATWYYAQTRDFGGLMDLGGWRKPDMANRYRKLAPSWLAPELFAAGWDFTFGDGAPAPRIRAIA